MYKSIVVHGLTFGYKKDMSFLTGRHEDIVLGANDSNKIVINPHKSLEDFDLKRIFADIRHKQDKIGEGEI